jgi:hypothetical protein
MIVKISWEMDTVAGTMTILKTDYTGWPKNSTKADIVAALLFYRVGKTISLKEFGENERYNSVMCTIVNLDHEKNVVNV